MSEKGPRKHWTKTRRVAVVVLAVYVLTMSCGRPADRVILFPPQGHINAGRAQRIVINPQGRDLEIWTARSPGLSSGAEPEAYVLEFTGNATRAEQIAQYVADRWKDHAVEVWVMNYPGYGGSAGGAHLALIPPAALAAYDELAVRAAGKAIFVEANSLGTTAALYVAANRKVVGAVLQNPPPLRNLIMGKYGWWNAWLVALPVSLSIPKELDSIANAKNVHVPAVFLLADHDEVVSPKYQKLVVDAYAGENQIIPLNGATHNSSVQGDADKQLHEAIGGLWRKAMAR